MKKYLCIVLAAKMYFILDFWAKFYEKKSLFYLNIVFWQNVHFFSASYSSSRENLWNFDININSFLQKKIRHKIKGRPGENGVFKWSAIHEKWEKWIKMLIFLPLTCLWLRKTGGNQISTTSRFCAYPYFTIELKTSWRCLS